MELTAIEWMIEEVQELREKGDTDLRSVLYRLNKAKEMEKQQMINFTNNYLKDYEDITVLQYYNETFKSE